MGRVKNSIEPPYESLILNVVSNLKDYFKYKRDLIDYYETLLI